MIKQLLRDVWGIDAKVVVAKETTYSKVYFVDNTYVLKYNTINSIQKQELINHCMEICNIDTIQKVFKTKTGQNLHYHYSLYEFKRCDTKDTDDLNFDMISQTAQTLALIHKTLAKEKDLEKRVSLTIGDVYPTETGDLSTYDDEDIAYTAQKIKDSLKTKPHLFNLPEQIGHFDFTPSNLIFYNNKLTGVIDFDIMRVSERARDVVITQRKISNREEDRHSFLEIYNEANPLLEEEINSLDDLYFDEIRRKLIYTIRRYKKAPQEYEKIAKHFLRLVC
jgi:Ser/Thr protein kinase RdoA (MazF antagonist)